MLNAAWLETFTVLSGLESFTRTAARLNMTQPGVSQHVKKLEAQVGKPLLERHGKGFSLTDAGAAVAALGRRRQTEEEALRQELGQDDPARGQVRIACPGGFAVLLYDAVAAHLARAPGLMLSLQAAPQAAIEVQLLAGELDFGILHRKLDAPRLTAEPLGRDRLNLILPPDGPAEPDFDALQDLGMIGHPDGAALADRLLGANYGGYRGAAGLRQRAFLNQIGQILAPVAAGTGYTILPQTAVLAQSAQRQFRIAALAHPQADELWLISQRRDPPPARLAAFGEAIRTVSSRLDQ